MISSRELSAQPAVPESCPVAAKPLHRGGQLSLVHLIPESERLPSALASSPSKESGREVSRAKVRGAILPMGKQPSEEEAEPTPARRRPSARRTAH
jgi:hypothetical protein